MDTWTDISTDADGTRRCSRCGHARPFQPNQQEFNAVTPDADTLRKRAIQDTTAASLTPIVQTQDVAPAPTGTAIERFPRIKAKRAKIRRPKKITPMD
jgi:hypothetical protein